MSALRASLTVIEAGDLPVYPIDREERLPELAFVKWYPARWLSSSAHLRCSYEVQGVARALFDLSAAQSPIGTLPDDNEELAALLRLPVAQWISLRGLADRGPLRNWVPCLCPRGAAAPEVRLMHHVVTAGLQDVLSRREGRERARGQQAVGKRMQRLREAMKGYLSPAQMADDVLMTRIDDWLAQRCTGNRMAHHYVAAFEEAVRQRWID